jgi:predicted nucleic acid-binding protein
MALSHKFNRALFHLWRSSPPSLPWRHQFFIALGTGRVISPEAIPDEIALSITTIGELRLGVHAAQALASRSRRLEMPTRVLALYPLPIDLVVVAANGAQLRRVLSDRGLRMPMNDSWIAVTTIF